MGIVLKNVTLIDSGSELYSVRVDGKLIDKISKSIEPQTGDEVIDCNGRLLISGFYNTHCHSAMTALRGYADDLELWPWLSEKIFPAEAKLTPEVVYWGSAVAIAEMLRSGCVSFSDMYFNLDQTAKIVSESGIKANLSRNIVAGADADYINDAQFVETRELVDGFNGYDDNRIICEATFHAEYTNAPETIAFVADYAKSKNLGIHFHCSETQNEHNECIGRHGKTPIALFESLGALDVRAVAAHCVWVSDEDMEIMARKKVSVAHNPISNLKLGSGVARLGAMKKAGVNVSLGTDGASSNNRLDMIRELQVAALIQKGVNNNPTLLPATEIYKIATKNGAVAQGRFDCGEIKEGNRADMVLVSTDSPSLNPLYDNYSMLAYAAEASDVCMTMVDGKILYKDGEYKTLDIEKIRYEASNTLKDFFKK